MVKTRTFRRREVHIKEMKAVVSVTERLITYDQSHGCTARIQIDGRKVAPCIGHGCTVEANFLPFLRL